MDKQFEGFEHAQTLQERIASLKGDKLERRHLLAIAYDFDKLLDLAVKVVSTSYGDQERAIEELESYLR